MRWWRGTCALASGAVLALAASCTGEDPSIGPDASTTPAPSEVGDGGDGGGGLPSDASDDGADGPEGDGGCTNAMPFVHFAPASGNVNTAGFDERFARLRRDELVMWVTRSTSGSSRIIRFDRASVDDAWIERAALDPGTVLQREGWPSLDGRRFYWSQLDPSAAPVNQRFWLIRGDLDDAGAVLSGGFVPDVALAGIDDLSPFLSLDESELWFASTRGGQGFNIQHALRSDAGGYPDAQPVAELNTTGDELSIALADDRRTIYFASTRDRTDLRLSSFIATRADASGAFGSATLVPGFEAVTPGDASSMPSWLSPDQCRLYLSTNKDGATFDVYVASRR